VTDTAVDPRADDAPLKPPFSYYGGKSQLAPWIASLLPPHRVYVEPFVGSGAVLFAKRRSTHEIINDANGDVVTFFRVLRDQPEGLERECRLSPYARAEFARADLDDQSIDDMERARRFWVRVNQSFAKAGAKNTGWSTSIKRGSNNARSAANRLDRLHAIAERLMHVTIESRRRPRRHRRLLRRRRRRSTPTRRTSKRSARRSPAASGPAVTTSTSSPPRRAPGPRRGPPRDAGDRLPVRLSRAPSTTSSTTAGAVSTAACSAGPRTAGAAARRTSPSRSGRTVPSTRAVFRSHRTRTSARNANGARATRREHVRTGSPAVGTASPAPASGRSQPVTETDVRSSVRPRRCRWFHRWSDWSPRHHMAGPGRTWTRSCLRCVARQTEWRREYD
jgi:hypothetical protein